MTEDRIVEAEGAEQLVQGTLVALDIQEDVVSFVDLGDGMCQLATAPVFLAVYRAAASLDHRPVTLYHTGHLLTLVRMDQENDLIMTHVGSLRNKAARRRRPRCGKEK
jgi:hypothetical protein